MATLFSDVPPTVAGVVQALPMSRLWTALPLLTNASSAVAGPTPAVTAGAVVVVIVADTCIGADQAVPSQIVV